MKLGFLKEDGCGTIVVGRERLHADAFDPAMTALAFASAHRQCGYRACRSGRSKHFDVPGT